MVAKKGSSSNGSAYFDFDHPYRKAWILSLVLHFVLLILVGISFALSFKVHALKLQPEVAVIAAKVIYPAQIVVHKTQLSTQKMATHPVVTVTQKQPVAKAPAKSTQLTHPRQKNKIAEKSTVLSHKKTNHPAKQQKKTGRMTPQKKPKTEQVHQKTDTLKKQEKAQKALKLAQQKVRNNQIAAEKKVLKAAREKARLRQIERYTALILHTMRQNWIIPAGVDPSLSCQLAIVLDKSGQVIRVTLLRSSGNVALDNSARLAVLKSSPLPVPADLKLFRSVFRKFHLTVRPQDQ